MTSIADIRDQDSFGTWLEETGQPSDACIALAVRTALRVLPLVWADPAVSPLPFLRANLVASIRGLAPSEVLGERLDVSNSQIDYFKETEAAEAAGDNCDNPTSAYAASAAALAARTACNYAPAAYSARTVGTASRAATAAAAYTAADAVWADLRSDCQQLADGGELRHQPLFAETKPDWFDRAFGEVRAAATPEWSFWLDWYQLALEGREQNWPLLLEIATQDDAFWQGSDAEVNARIAAIVERHRPVDPDPVAATVAKSPNAERIVQTPDRIYDVVPVREIARDPYALVIRRVRNALADIARLIEQDTNQYNALSQVADLVGRELEQSLDAPLLVYETLMQAIIVLDHQSEVGDLPPSDRQIEHVRNRFNNSALDILLNDKAVRDAVTARAAFKVSRLSPEEANQVQVLADALAQHSTHRLANLLRKGSIDTTSAEVSEEVRRIAIYEYGSRTIRMYSLDKETFNTAANAASIFGFIAMVIGWFR